MGTKANQQSRTVAAAPGVDEDAGLPVTARRMYDAEIALHCANQTHVDAWIRAAYDHLHEAILAHNSAVAAAWPASVCTDTVIAQDRRDRCSSLPDRP